MKPTAPLAIDTRSLDALKTQAGRDPKEAIKQAASQFEALFMRQLLKSMREAMPKSGMWDSPGQAMYVDMFDQQLAQTMSGRKGGLGEVIARQLSGGVKGGIQADRIDMDSAAAPPGNAVAAAAAAAAMAAARSAHAGGPSGAIRDPARVPGTASRALDAAGAMAPSPMPDLKSLSATQASFVKRMWPHAQQAQQATGVPAAFIVGQAALESGWGKHEIRGANGASSHNLFGIKAGGKWNGSSVAARTTEFVDGQPRKQVERFRSYGSYAEAFRDWASLIANSPRYGDVMRAGGSVEGFAHGMQRAGYATDPKYGAKLERTINQTLMLKRLVI